MTNRSERDREYRQRNAEKIRKSQQEYREQNREKLRESQRELRKRDPERTRRWKDANRDKVRAYELEVSRRRRQEQPERERARLRTAMRKRRAVKRRVPHEQVSEALLFDIWGGVCAICGDPLGENWEVDHIIPISRGGWDTYENLVPVHGTRSDHFSCNQGKHDSIDWDSPEVQVVLEEFIVNDGAAFAISMLHSGMEAVA